MTALLIFEIIYIMVVLFTIIRVITDTRNSAKALAYILFIIFVPVLGVLFYFWFGINYRKRKLYKKKIFFNEEIRLRVYRQLSDYHERIKETGLLNPKHLKLTDFIYRSSKSPLTANNSIRLLINGEEKFEALLKVLRTAKHHIHIEYYILRMIGQVMKS